MTIPTVNKGQSIQNAINSASAGDTVVVKEGTTGPSPPPPPVINPIDNPYGEETFDVSWSDVDASHYEVEYIFRGEMYLIEAPSNTYSIVNGEWGTHTFRVRAVNSPSLFSEWSESVHTTVKDTSQPPPNLTINLEGTLTVNDDGRYQIILVEKEL